MSAASSSAAPASALGTNSRAGSWPIKGRIRCGATSPMMAAPGTIGFDYSLESYELSDAGDWAIKNIIHGSDSTDNAEREIGLWFAPEELVARVKALLRRSQEERHEVLRYADVELDTGTRVAHRGTREIELSPTEYELLLLFMRRPRQVLTREIILDRVWGMDFEGSSNVLEVYVGYLRTKLEAGGESRLIHTVRGVGYVFKE